MWRVDDRSKFLEIFRAYLDRNKKPGFIPDTFCRRGVVWNGHTLKGGLHIEGGRPMSIVTENGQSRITFTNSDSNYTAPIGSVLLEEVEYLDFFGLDQRL